MGSIKLENEYMKMFNSLYYRTPKSVFAAVLASLLSTGGDNPKTVKSQFLEEWGVLYDNKIVPQSPPKS